MCASDVSRLGRDAQSWTDGELLIGRRFDMRALAMQWACTVGDLERRVMKVTQEQIYRWFADVDPLIKALRALGEKIEQARTKNASGPEVEPFMNMVNNELPEELNRLRDGFLDAKGRLLGFGTLEELDKAMELLENEKDEP